MLYYTYNSYGAHLSSNRKRYHKMLPYNKHRNGYSERIEKHRGREKKKRFNWWKSIFFIHNNIQLAAAATCLWVLFPHSVLVCVSVKFFFCDCECVLFVPNIEIMYAKCVHVIHSFTHNNLKYRNSFWSKT